LATYVVKSMYGNVEGLIHDTAGVRESFIFPNPIVANFTDGNLLMALVNSVSEEAVLLH